MNRIELITEFIKGIETPDFKTENRKEFKKVVETILSEIETEAKIEYPQKEFHLYKQVLVLRNMIEDMANEMYMNKMTFNNKIQMVNNVLNYK